MIKKILKILMVIALVFLFLLGIKVYYDYKNSFIAITSIQMNMKNFGLKIKESRQIEYDTYPRNATDNVVWKSNNERVIEVNRVTGYVTALREGEAIVQAYDSKGNLLGECLVYGVKNEINLLDINVEEELNIINGHEYLISLNPLPINSTNIKINYISSDESVITVDNSGRIKANGVGSAYIVITNKNNTFEKRILVNVSQSEEYTNKENIDYVTNVRKIKLENNKISIKENDVYQINYEIEPSNATNKEITFKSLNEEIVEVLENGVIRGKKEGNTYIELQTSNNIIEKVKVEVKGKKINNDEIIVIGVNVSEKDISLLKGESKNIKVTIVPNNASNKNVIWKSSNPSIATVDSSGNIKGIGTGDCEITVTSNNNIKSTINVKVSEKIVEVTDIGLSSQNVKIGVLETKSIKVQVSPTNATNKSLTWKSSDSSIATVNNDGLIRGVKEGNAIITVTAHNGVTKEIQVTVENTKVTDLILSKTSTSLKVGGSETLSYTIFPRNLSNKKATWKSSNPSVVSVSSTGVIKGVSVGEATITCDVDGLSRTVKVNVLKNTIDIKNIIINGAAQVGIGENITLKAIIEPSNATNQMIKWRSSNSSIATIDENGVVKGIKSGEVKISATAGGVTASKTITVNNVEVNSLKVDKSQINLEVGKTEVVNVTIEPTNATNKNLIWSSSDTNIATVSSSGIITAVKSGTATITVTSNNNKKASLDVLVSYAPKNVNSAKYTQTTDTLKISIVEKNGYFLTYIWALNPNKQMKKFVAPESATSGIQPTELLKKAIKKNKLETKLILASNASTIGIKDSYDGDFYKCEYDGEYAWYGKATANNVDEPSSLQIINGEVTRFAPGSNEFCKKNTYIYYISKANKLSYIPPATKDNGYDSTLKKANLFKTVIDDGAYNTFTFGPVLISDKKIMTNDIKNSKHYGISAARQAFCQINNNNFILVTSNEQGSPACYDTSECKSWKIEDLASYLKELGCINAINFDGGGSTTLMFKKSNKDTATLVTHNGNSGKQRSNSSIMYFTELN